MQHLKKFQDQSWQLNEAKKTKKDIYTFLKDTIDNPDDNDEYFYRGYLNVTVDGSYYEEKGVFHHLKKISDIIYAEFTRDKATKDGLKSSRKVRLTPENVGTDIKFDELKDKNGKIIDIS